MQILKYFIFYCLLFSCFCINAQVLLDLNERRIAKHIKKIILEIDTVKNIIVIEDTLKLNPSLRRTYQNRTFQRLWKEPRNSYDLVNIIRNSYYDGLNPQDYNYQTISDIENLNLKRKNGALKQAKADVIMTNALLNLSDHLVYGKTDPFKLDENWDFDKKQISDSLEYMIRDHLKKNSLPEFIDDIRPKVVWYNKFKKYFAKFDSIKNINDDINQINYPNEILKQGDSLDIIKEIKLNLSYYFSFSDLIYDNVFDTILKNIIIDFQKQHGLYPDGLIGVQTFEAINLSLEDRMDILRVNMEKCRWIDPMPEYYILVNIPNYYLYVYENNNISFESRVVVGKEDFETPVFSSDIKYIVFNPTWTIPYSISSQEILPKLKTDSLYLQYRNMQLLYGSDTIDPLTIDFNQYDEEYFPFVIKQGPGSNNSMGLVKFMFPNKHSVYLHDSPSKPFFEENERAFSHGCVRVKGALEMSAYFLEDQNYTTEIIDSILLSRQTHTVYLNKLIPVKIMYWTCFENSSNGKLYFYKDIYNRDERILQSLNSKFK